MTRDERFAWWPLAAVIATAIAVRLYQLGTIPLWSDEMFTRFYPNAGLSYLWGEGLRSEPTSPLYYSLIAVLERVAGASASVIRIPSVLGSLASVFLAWRLGRELFAERTAAPIGALFVALAPLNVFYAQEARSYALQGAALALSLLGLARLLRNGSGAMPFAAGGALAIWLHPTSIVAVAAIGVAPFAAALPPVRLMPPRALLRWLGAGVVIVLACLPLLPSIVSPPHGGAATSWVPSLTRWSLESVVGETLAGPAFARQAQLVAEIGLPLLALPFVFPLWRPGWRPFYVLVFAPVLALALMIGISLFKPILLSRTLAWLLVPLAVALGSVLSRRHKLFAIASIGLVAAGLAVQIARAPSLKEDWPGLFAQMPDMAPPTLVVLAPVSPPAAVALYAPQSATPVRLEGNGPPIPETTVMPRLFGTPTTNLAELQAAIASGRPVWLIYRRPEYDWVRREITGLPPPQRTVQSEPGPNPALRALFW